MESLTSADPGQVGAYRLLGRLGAGGMGEVFLGESPGGRRVAVKLLKTEHAQDRQFRQRFAREVAAAKMVGGFHTAPVVDADPDGDPPWLVTAYIPGPSLTEAVRQRGPLSPEAVRRLGAALAEGLAAIHACGLVHRDLKPSNIILADDGPRIIDFGVAWTAGGADLTSTGMLIGTISYMSPEQVAGARVDARSDVFSLGGVLAYAATGHGPFDGPTLAATAARICAGPPDLDGIAGPLREIIAACLDKNPAARPALAELTPSLTGTPRPRARTPQPEARAPYPERIGPTPPVATLAAPAPADPTLAFPPRGRRKPVSGPVIAAVVIVAAAIGGAAYLLSGTGSSGAGGGARSQPPPNLIPAAYTGAWQGTLDSSGLLKGSRAATLTVTKATADGAAAGHVSYTGSGFSLDPAPDCTYAFRLASASASRLTLRAAVTSGPCRAEWVILTPSSQGLTDTVYDTVPSQADGPAYTGTLSRPGASASSAPRAPSAPAPHGPHERHGHGHGPHGKGHDNGQGGGD